MSLMEKETVDMVREAQKKYAREYQRNWRKKNPEKAKAIQIRYWIKKYNEMQKESDH